MEEMQIHVGETGGGGGEEGGAGGLPLSPSSENLLDLLSRMAHMTGEGGAGTADDSEPMFSFSHTQRDSDQIQQRFEREFITRFAAQYSEDCTHYELTDPIPFVTHGMQAIVKDEFTECFEPMRSRPWNWNVYLFPLWVLGVFVRYAVLFPLRVLGVAVGCTVAFTLFVTASCMPTARLRAAGQRAAIRVLSFFFLMSWAGVIMFHSAVPARRANQIFVANHTSVIDVAVLMQDRYMYALVGQAHTGVLGFLQRSVLGCLGCIWFERSQAKDRAAVASTISEYIRDSSANPLLLFPEGVCVNTDHVVMFKKGVFAMDGVEICPIAIKYHTAFSDPYWHSRSESFVRHLVRLMLSWAVVADVTYLTPVTRKPNQTPVAFANMVKSSIARAAGLRDTPWDGFLKYVSPSPRFTEHQRQIYTRALLLRFKNADRKRAQSLARIASGESSPSTENIPDQPPYLGFHRVPSPEPSPVRSSLTRPDPPDSLSDVSDFSDDDDDNASEVFYSPSINVRPPVIIGDSDVSERRPPAPAAE